MGDSSLGDQDCEEFKREGHGTCPTIHGLAAPNAELEDAAKCEEHTALMQGCLPDV